MEIDNFFHAKNLTGKKFGYLIVKKIKEKNKWKKLVWECLCDCGNTCFVVSNRLINGTTKSCGCRYRDKDIIGKRFGKLTILSAVKQNNRTFWECQCDCGNKILSLFKNLSCGDRVSCGCIKKDRNLLNKKFNNLTVIQYVGLNKRRNSVWRCRCNCSYDSFVNVTSTNLINNIKKDCGCISRNTSDPTGKKFGRLEVLEYYKKDKWGGYIYKCKCSCGKITFVLGAKLFNGKTKSCGCLVKKLAGVSAKNQVFASYKKQAEYRDLVFCLTFDDLIKLTGGNCYYCGGVPSNKKTTNNGDFIYNGIDRKNNLKGYTLDNCVSCCIKCNRMKMALGEKEFYEHIELLYKIGKKLGRIK